MCLDLGEWRAFLEREREPAAGGQGRDDRVEEGAFVAEGEHRLQEKHDVEGSLGKRGDHADLEAAGESVGRGTLPGHVHGAAAPVDPDVVAAQLAGDEPPGTGDPAAQVEDPDSRAHSGALRQRPDLRGAHEALLTEELPGRIRHLARPPQCTVERVPFVLPHECWPESAATGSSRSKGDVARETAVRRSLRTHSHRTSLPNDSTSSASAAAVPSATAVRGEI